jgi:cytochrome d ubiquinol oxidase subunit II
VVPPVIFGVAFGNLLQGVPFHYDEIFRFKYTGSFLALLNPFALLVGVLSLMMFVAQGASYLQMKTKAPILQRSQRIGTITGFTAAILFILCGIWLHSSISGYVVTSAIDTNAINSVMNKTAEIKEGAWLENFVNMPILWAAPILRVVAFLLTGLFSYAGKGAFAFVSSSLGQAGVILTCGFAMFPFIMPSSSQPAHSLTIWDATSSELTLKIMFFVACIFVPIVLGYTIWSYIKMFGRITEQDIRDNPHTLY